MLEKCSECGKEISSEAKACPGCGHPIQRDKAAKFAVKGCLGCFVIFIIGAVIFGGLDLINASRKNNALHESEKPKTTYIRVNNPQIIKTTVGQYWNDEIKGKTAIVYLGENENRYVEIAILRDEIKQGFVETSRNDSKQVNFQVRAFWDGIFFSGSEKHDTFCKLSILELNKEKKKLSLELVLKLINTETLNSYLALTPSKIEITGADFDKLFEGEK